jgi:hypothetical protein
VGGCPLQPIVNHLGAGAEPLGASLMRDGVFDVSKYPVAKKTTAKTATRATINGTKLPFIDTSNFLLAGAVISGATDHSGYSLNDGFAGRFPRCLGSPVSAARRQRPQRGAYDKAARLEGSLRCSASPRSLTIL